ncbi:hypothetical protein HDZ31DRAFT_61437 [Schizophyllum fasciatum]
MAPKPNHLTIDAASQNGEASQLTLVPRSTKPEDGEEITSQHKRKLSEARDSDDEIEVVKDESEGEEGPAKKARPSYTRHERFWLLDGNVVLQIGQTRFRLHRSRLASQSPWFEALFEKHAGREPNADHGGQDLDKVTVEEDEGVGVFHLGEDNVLVSLSDFVELLKAMDEAIAFRYSSPGFLVHAAIYRAADDLIFPAYREYAQRFMEEEFSDALDTVTAEIKPHAAEAVQLADNWYLPRLFKRAFYELARNPNAYNAGLVNDDGDNVLEGGLMLRLLSVQKNLAKAWTQLVLSDDNAFQCKTPKCHSDRPENYWAALENDGFLGKHALDPIYGLQVLATLDWSKHNHCTHCKRARRSAFARKRLQLWKDMDGWMPTQ